MFPQVGGLTLLGSQSLKDSLSGTSFVNIFNFQVFLYAFHQFANFSTMKIESNRKESSLTFPPKQVGTKHADEEREKACPIYSSSNAEPGCSKNSQNGHRISSILVLISERLAEARSELITMINKNSYQPVSLGDSDSYCESFHTTDPQKTKQEIPILMIYLY